MLTLFGNGNGVPPTNGINLVYNDATGGATLHTLADGNFAFSVPTACATCGRRRTQYCVPEWRRCA